MPADPEHEWGCTARGGAASPLIDVPRAKALGGCSAHNATVAMRGRLSRSVTYESIALAPRAWRHSIRLVNWFMSK